MTGPYRWDSERPEALLPRAEFEVLAGLLSAGERAMVYAGHGMGKSVLLRWLQAQLSARGMRVAYLAAPAGLPLHEALRRALGPDGRDLHEAISTACATSPVAVLIDEADAWVAGDRVEATCLALTALDKASRDEQQGRLGVLVAGGLGQHLLNRSILGSPFASRVERTTFLEPLSATELRSLAGRLRERRQADGADVFEEWCAELQLASGGVPALAARALQLAWALPLDRPLVPPAELLGRWIADQHSFRASVRGSVIVGDRDFAWRLLDRIRAATDGEVPYADLDAICPPGTTPDGLIRLLVSAGLVHPDRDLSAEPALVRPSPSVLLGDRPRAPRAATALDQLYADLQAVAGELSLHRADLRVGSGANRALVPEALFTAMVSIALKARGWQVEREAQRGEGRTDLMVRGSGLAGHAIVEVKRWGNADLPLIFDQLAGYVNVDQTFADHDQTVGLAALVVAGPEVAAADLVAKLPRLDLEPTLTRGSMQVWRSELGGPPSIPLATLVVAGLFRSTFG